MTLDFRSLTWRGACGHLWDRAIENTEECPRCAMESRLPNAIARSVEDSYAHSARDERARIRALIETASVLDLPTGAYINRDDLLSDLAAVEGDPT